MTKQEVFDKFYERLTPEEKEGGPEGLPDMVVHISAVQPPLTKSQLDWAKMVVKSADLRFSPEQ